MKKNIILNVVVIMIAVFLAGCQHKEAVLPTVTSGLFLKSAQAGQTASVVYFSDGKMEKFYYPNNLLFEITPSSTAKVLNSFLLEVKDYDVSADNKASFLVVQAGSHAVAVGEIGGKQIVDSNVENVSAVKLPFTSNDYGQQGEGWAKFNGLLKADHYVLAVNVEADKISLYDLNSGKTTIAAVTIKDDVLNSDLGTLRFIKHSPVGNIFDFSLGSEKYPGYTLN